MNKIEELQKKYNELDDEFVNMQNDCIQEGLDWNEMLFKTESVRNKLRDISHELDLVKPIEWEEFPDYGDIMPMELFKECVDEGGFIDYDGHGNYANLKKGMSNKMIVPSDFKYNHVLDNEDFTHVVWFNK